MSRVFFGIMKIIFIGKFTERIVLITILALFLIAIVNKNFNLLVLTLIALIMTGGVKG